MFFYLSKSIQLLFTPSNFLVICLLAASLALAIGVYRRLARRLVYLTALGLAVCGFSPIGAWLTLPLEQRHPRPETLQGITGIILLGGFEQPHMAAARGVIASNEAGERLLETIILAKKLPRTKIIITGAAGTLIKPHIDATVPVGRYIQRMGIAKNRIVLEPRARTTYENARETYRLLQPQKSERYLLVTSAYHMPRALGVFRAQGFTVRPWPVDFRTRGWSDLARPFSSATEGLKRVDLAVKEWIGLLAYYLTGRTRQLLP